MSTPGKTKELLVSFALALLFVVGMSCLTTLEARAQSANTETASTGNTSSTESSTTTTNGTSGSAQTSTTETGKNDASKSRAPCPGDCVPCRQAQQWFQIFLFVLMTGVLLFIVKMLFARLDKSDWDLGRALSEEADLTKQPNALPETVTRTVPGVEGKLEEKETFSGGPALVPSTSRLIALFGMIVLVVYFIALAYYTVWALLNCTKMSATDDIKLVLYAGAALFAPYAVNKMADLFKFK